MTYVEFIHLIHESTYFFQEREKEVLNKFKKEHGLLNKEKGVLQQSINSISIIYMCVCTFFIAFGFSIF